MKRTSNTRKITNRGTKRGTKRGTGAGGSNTNHNGKNFETKTSNEPRLYSNGFNVCVIPNTKHTYLEKITTTHTIRYISQQSMYGYVKYINKFDFDKYDRGCYPDEAYLFIPHDDSQTKHLKIIEKKNQNCDGSVEDKLATFDLYRRMYQTYFPNYTIGYAYCVSDYLKKKYVECNKMKWKTMRQLHQDNNIRVLFGDESNYFETLDNWLYSGFGWSTL